MFDDQANTWSSSFGDEYTKRNTFNKDSFEKSYLDKFGITKNKINSHFIEKFKKDYSFLEMGCNIGNQLNEVYESGFTNLTGIDIQSNAIKKARETLPNIKFHSGRIESTDFANNSFDVILTNNVLIHLNAANLELCINEMIRVSKKYIWCFEYFNLDRAEIDYRNHKNLLWKDDFKKYFIERGGQLIQSKFYNYTSKEERGNIDEMFLIELHK